MTEAMQHRPLTGPQGRLIKTRGRLARHASRLVYRMAKVLVTRKILGRLLERK